MTAISATLGAGETSDAVAGSFIMRSWANPGHATIQLEAAASFDCRLEGSAMKTAAGAERWREIGAFTASDIQTFEVSMGVRYRVRCVTGAAVQVVVTA